MFNHKTEELRREMQAAQRALKADFEKRVTAMNEQTQEQIREINSRARNETVSQRVKQISREWALEKAMHTPGVTCHEDVLKAAAAYEHYMNGELPRPAH